MLGAQPYAAQVGGSGLVGTRVLTEVSGSHRPSLLTPSSTATSFPSSQHSGGPLSAREGAAGRDQRAQSRGDHPHPGEGLGHAPIPHLQPGGEAGRVAQDKEGGSRGGCPGGRLTAEPLGWLLSLGGPCRAATVVSGHFSARDSAMGTADQAVRCLLPGHTGAPAGMGRSPADSGPWDR